MRRFRLSTLLLLLVIVALSIALVVKYRRAARREAELQTQQELNGMISHPDHGAPPREKRKAALRPADVETPGAKEGTEK